MAATLPDLETVTLRRGASNGAELRIELDRPERMNASPPASCTASMYARESRYASRSHTVQLARSSAVQMPITGRAIAANLPRGPA